MRAVRWCWALSLTVGCLWAMAVPASAVEPAPVVLPATPGSESEPNDATATATPIQSGRRIRATLQPAGEVDVYRFEASAGDRVYAAVMTSGDSSVSGNSRLTLLGPDGTSEIEVDDNDGSFNASSSSIAGAPLAAGGTHYLRVDSPSAGVTLRPYDLYLQLRSGTPPPEAEPANEVVATAPALAGEVQGVHATIGDTDHYSLNLNAGDTVYLALDLDPERDGTQWAGRLSFGQFGNADDQFLSADDNGAEPGPSSEAFFMTVLTAGTYTVRVDSTSGVAAVTDTYRLSATVIPAATPSCRTYASTNSGPIPDLATSTFQIPVTDPAEISRLAVGLDLTHAFMQDVDVTLRAPNGDGVEFALFTDIGAATVNGQQTRMQVMLDKNAAIPSQFPVTRPMMLQPELNTRLEWLEGTRAEGVWTLVIRDDAVGDEGELASAELVICARPPDEPRETVFRADFEGGADGFQAGADLTDQWALGTPNTPAVGSAAALTACGQGTACFKTNLTGTYAPSSQQVLTSPPISLAGRTGPLRLAWLQWFQMESASFDNAWVTIEEEGGANARELWRWSGSTMSQTVGNNPPVTVATAAGWARQRADISDYAGDTVRLRFHLTSDTSIQLSGLAIDDVHVTEEILAPANTAPPAISGTPRQGETLTADPGQWTGTPTSFAYRWLRCDAACVQIPAATGPTHVATPEDVGRALVVRVIATNARGDSAPALSAPTAPVAPPAAQPGPPPAAAPPSVIRRARVTQTRHLRTVRTRAVLQLTTSGPGRATVVLTRTAPGIRRSTKCVAVPRNRPAAARPCVRQLRVGRLVRSLNRAGVHRIVLRRAGLVPGRYRARIVLADAGVAGRATVVNFRVRPRPPLPPARRGGA